MISITGAAPGPTAGGGGGAELVAVVVVLAAVAAGRSLPASFVCMVGELDSGS